MKRMMRAMAFAVVAIGFAIVRGYAATINGVDVVIHPESEPVTGSLVYDLAPMDGHAAEFSVDGVAIAISRVPGRHLWKPLSVGQHTVAHTVNGMTMSATYNVVAVDYWTQPEPNPPMPVVDSISITPVTREIPQGGGGAAILTSGIGDWTAAVDGDWITLNSNSTSGSAGGLVSYIASVNPDVEDRIGYVYVAGRVHTVTQKGLGATVSTTGFELERDGGTKTLRIEPADTRSAWKARSNNNWITVSPTSGTGSAEVTLRVAPWYKVSTRSGSVTIGGKTVTVFQRGTHLKIAESRKVCDGSEQTFRIEVNALETTEWSVTANADWISVSDAGTSSGNGTVVVSVAKNPDYKSRTGTIAIGTETYTVVQEGKTELDFAATGATIAVDTVVEDGETWSIENLPKWLTVEGTLERTGPGVVVLTATANDSTEERAAVVAIAGRNFNAFQKGSDVKVEADALIFDNAGGMGTVTIRPDGDGTAWRIVSSDPSWLTIFGEGTGTGEGIVYFIVSPLGEGETKRTGTIGVGDKLVTITQWANMPPHIAGDNGADVIGDAESGFVVKPGDGNRVVEVTVPEGVDAAKVTVEVSPETVSVKPNGATVKIVREANGVRHDITGFLDLPAAVDGVVNVGEATVKEEYAKEPLDVAKGAVVTLGVEEPTIRTAPTRAGLTYKFYEGTTLEGLLDGEPAKTKVGDGAPWEPEIMVKGGRSGFYSIIVEK